MATPERTCIGCGAKLPATALVRLHLVDGGVAVDGGRGAGRGAWIHSGGACLARAVKRKGFARAFRTPVEVHESLLREQLTGGGSRV